MRDMENLDALNVGQTIVIRQIFGKKKIMQSTCTVEGVYKNFILVEHNDNKVRESYMKVDFFTGLLEYETCV